MNSGHPMLPVADLSESANPVFEINGRRIAVFREGETIYAVDEACPHKGAPLSHGGVEEGRLVCPFHGWVFDAASGECLTNPSCSVQTYKTRVENGMLYVQIPESNPPQS